MLLNLINNALYAMDGCDQGNLTIVTQPGKTAGWVEILVTDTGCGIKKEFMDKIFDPFFTTKKVGDGTGLGLSVSYGIISKYGGSITCQSHTEDDAPGRPGTTFTIALPARPDSTELSPGSPA